MASRILGISALRDVLEAFSADTMPSADTIDTVIQNDIARIEAMQNWDGGFPYWQRGRDSIPFNTIHVAHALTRAQAEGYEVSADKLANAMAYLGDIAVSYTHLTLPTNREV